MDNYGLERICPFCRESGEIVNPKFIEWSLNNCVGKRPEDEIIKCPVCNGTLIIPTESGVEILELVDKYRRE